MSRATHTGEAGFLPPPASPEPTKLFQAPRQLDKQEVRFIFTPIFLGDSSLGLLAVDRLFSEKV